MKKLLTKSNLNPSWVKTCRSLYYWENMKLHTTKEEERRTTVKILTDVQLPEVNKLKYRQKLIILKEI